MEIWDTRCLPRTRGDRPKLRTFSSADVCPAHAGIDLAHVGIDRSRSSITGLPRTRGDRPVVRETTVELPRTRGDRPTTGLPRTRGDRPIDEAHGETRTVIVSKAPFTPHWVTLVFSGNVWSEPLDGMRLITAYQDRTLEKSRGKPWLTIPENSK